MLVVEVVEAEFDFVTVDRRGSIPVLRLREGMTTHLAVMGARAVLGPDERDEMRSMFGVATVADEPDWHPIDLPPFVSATWVSRAPARP